MTAADRKLRWKARRDAGLVVLPVEVEFVEVSEGLVEAGELDPTKCEDRKEVARALAARLRNAFRGE